MLVFTNVIYNATLHRWYTTRNNKFLTKIFAVSMPSYLNFATAKVKIKLLSHFFPNCYGCGTFVTWDLMSKDTISYCDKVQTLQAYSENCQTSKINCFAKIVNGFLLLPIFAKLYLRFSTNALNTPVHLFDTLNKALIL